MNQENIYPEVIINGRLCIDHLNLFENELDNLKLKKIKRLKIILDSPGGDVNVAIKITNYIIRLKDEGVEINTHGFNLVGSGALFIYLHGIRRTLEISTSVVVDLPYKVYDKKLLLGYPETGQVLTRLIAENDLIQLGRIEHAETISKITNQPIETIYKLDLEMKYLSANEALQLGFCHQIV